MALAQMQTRSSLPHAAVIGSFDLAERSSFEQWSNSQLLIELKQRRADLLAAVAEIETAISQPLPDVGLIAHIRWKVTKADRAKYRLMNDRIYPTILARVTGQKFDQVKKFREGYCAIQAAKSAHIALWTMDRVAEDWSGYKIAAKTKIGRIRERLYAEELLLQPLLF